MADSRAWFFPTSPRSPEVLLDDLRLMAQLDGHAWGNQLQQDFARLWVAERGFSAAGLVDPSFSARDRLTRAPRLLGLTYKPNRGLHGNFVLTEAGRALLNAPDPSLVFQRQIAKVQFGSPLHNSGGFQNMRIRPLTAVAYLILQLGKLTHDEIAMYVLTTLDCEALDTTCANIRGYRQALTGYAPGRPRSEFRAQRFLDRVEEVYSQDISDGDIALREGNRAANQNLLEFLETKRRNLRDYADATMRYLVATGIFVRDIRAQALTFSAEGEADGRFLLNSIGLRPRAIDELPYDRYVLDYLGSLDSPRIRRDDPVQQAADLANLTRRLAPLDPGAAAGIEVAFRTAETANRLQILRQAEITVSERMEWDEMVAIRSQRRQYAREVVDQYYAIADRTSEQVARPLAFEWNTWRAMVIINDAIAIRGNFTRDVDGRPRTNAGGGSADIVAEFRSFWLVVEVTLSTGARQYETEGEPIMRHLGNVQLERQRNGDTRPVFALFIAESLHQAVVPYLRNLACINVPTYGGSVRIVPMRRTDFVAMMDRIVARPAFSSDDLLAFLQEVTDREYLMGTTDDLWLARISAGLA